MNLRFRGVLQKPTAAQDSIGGDVSVPADVATVWMEVLPLSTREQELKAQRQASTSHIVTIRHSTYLYLLSIGVQLASDWRILWQGPQGQRILVLDGDPVNEDEANEYWKLSVVENLRAQ